jgi:hypothetical protein
MPLGIIPRKMKNQNVAGAITNVTRHRENKDGGLRFANPPYVLDCFAARALRPQNILVHLAAVEMEKRHRGIVAQGAGGEALFEFVEDIPGHRMQVGQRL